VVRDIRQLTDSSEAYADALRRRWGGLLSYRHIGRNYASMDLDPEDNTVAIRRDMRNGAGELLLAMLGTASPEGGHMSDLAAVPNPVSHSCQGPDGTIAVRTVTYDEGAGDRITTGVLAVPFGRVRHFAHGCRNRPSEVGRQHRRR
jgi:hypothetical protein